MWKYMTVLAKLLKSHRKLIHRREEPTTAKNCRKTDHLGAGREGGNGLNHCRKADHLGAGWEGGKRPVAQEGTEGRKIQLAPQMDIVYASHHMRLKYWVHSATPKLSLEGEARL